MPSFRPGTPFKYAFAGLLPLFGLVGPADSAYAQLATTTTLSATNTSADAVTSVSSGTVVVLTASVNSGGGEVKLGTVKFCDTVSPHCEDGSLAGSAQLTSKGTAVLKFRPAPGTHEYQAFFHGTTTYAASASSVENLTVTSGPIQTYTALAQSGSVGDYTLTGTMTSYNGPPLVPTGPINFLDSTNNNYELASAALTGFTSTSNYAPLVGYNPGGTLGVIVADFNQDGIPDLLVWSESTFVYGGNDYIAILLGKGDGTFQAPIGYNFDPNSEAPTAVAVGDLNGDGYPDVVVADNTTNKIYVLLNDGSGDGRLGWQYQYLFPGYNDPEGLPVSVGPVTGLAIGDVNGDGKPDVVFTVAEYADLNYAQCGYTNQGAFGVMLGNGNGSLQTSSSPPWATPYPSGFCAEVEPETEPVELVDTRANGRLDVVVTDLNASNACVSLNNGDGTFASPTCYGAPAGQSVAVGDLNGDGYPDLVVSSWYSQNGASAVLLGKGDGTFQNVASNLPNFFPGSSSVALGDLNGDGNLDVVLGNNGASPGESPGTVSVSYGNGDGTFQTAIVVNATVIGDSVSGSAVADLNGNGVPDILATDNAATVNVMLGSLQNSATATVTGISPVGPAGNQDGVYASYAGDSYFAASQSAGGSLTTKPVPTTLGLTANVTQIVVGGQITLTATVTPDGAQGHSPSGAVTFFMNGNSIGTATPSNGVATLKPNLTVVQADEFTASYAGDSNFIGSSTTLAAAVVVQKASPTLTLGVCNYSTTWTCPATTSTYGQVIELSVTLAPYSISGAGSTDGETVTFYNNGTVIGTRALQDGGATMDLAQPLAGSYSFTASYGGDAIFNSSSTSAASPMTVQKVASSVTLTTYPLTASPYGQQMILTASFDTYPYNVGGETVTFYNGANVVGTAQLSSGTPSAILRLNDLPVGNYNFKVGYPGDSNFFSSSATAPVVAVQALATTLMVSAPSSTFTYGTPVTVQVFLEPYNVQGGNTTNGEPVILYQNGVSIGTAAVSNGVATFTINAPPVGTNAYTASYAGDTSFAASTAAAGYITVQQATTTMGIATNALHGIAATGQPITLTATISSNLATGTVIFFQNGNDIGNGTATNGVATLVVNGLPEGSYTFGASYSGDTNFGSSSASPTTSVTVLQATTLTLSTSPAHYAAPNQPVTITVTLSPYTPATDNTNGQMVYIYNGTSQFGNATLSNGVGTYTPTNGLPEGTYSFTAVYDSDGILANATTAAPVPFAVVTGQLFVVNTSADDAGTAAHCMPQSSTTINATDSACSLRDALLAAAAAPEGASISFATSAFTAPTTITLTNGGLTLPANTTLNGPTLNAGGANVTNLVTVDGNGTSTSQTSSTVFTVTGPGTAISNLTISGGWPYSDSVDLTNGGGILNSGVLTLTKSTITNNGTFNNGGGIYNTGTLTVVGSTFSNNTASADGIGDGGGIDNAGGTLTVINSTFANNTVRSGYGGGIAVDGGTATITNSTLTGNTVGGGGGGISSVVPNIEGVTSPGGTFTLANTIVSGNNDFFSDIADGGVAYTDQGGNIVGYINRTFTPVNDPSTLNLGPLDNYGGPTQTVLPLPGSQVICAANYLVSPSQWAPPLVAINIDQRGYPNYNLAYSQLPYSSFFNVCFDSGAVQTNYTSVQFQQSSYSGVAGGPATPTVVATVTENGVNRQAVPLTLSYSGPGNLSGNSATTAVGSGAAFSSLSVDTIGSGTLTATIYPIGTGRLTASTSLNILPPLVISPGSESIYAAAGVPLSQAFNVSNGSGNYQLSTSGTLPPGITLTPSGAATGANWTLSGTSSQQGSYNFTLIATDVTNSVITISQNYTLTIAPATTTTLAASPAASAQLGQTVTLTATVSSPTANGTVSFFDNGSLLGSSAASLSGGTPNTATFALNASTLGAPLALGTHSLTAQFSGDTSDAASTSNTVPYNVTLPNFVVNTMSDDAGSYTCATLASTTSNTTDGNNGGSPGLCTLRDALNTASGLGSGTIYFDSAVFAASNSAAANTIFPNIPSNGSLTVPANTTIQGLTSGSGSTLTNLVTVDGGGLSVTGNGTIFIAAGAGTAINNLNIHNGYASNGGSGGAITLGSFNGPASTTISGSSFTGNQATGFGGAIFNAFGSTLTVVNSTFSSNSATGGNGGAIDNSNFYGCGTTTVTNSTFYRNSAVNGGSGYGGAINNDGNGPCQVTVSNSTIVGNFTDNGSPSDGFGGGGGGIYSQYLLYLANNVMTGNTINGASEDDLDDNFWQSNYTSGDTYASTSMINGNIIGTWNGYAENGTSAGIAPLGSYGGPTQTMIPLPDSVAICAGQAPSIAAGVTTDQRGFSNSNANYPGFSSSTPCVDAGAVQTNYAITFAVEPPSTGNAGSAITPAPVLSVTESGAPAAFATGPVTMTDTAGLLGGSTSANLTAGSAAFSNLLFNTSVTSDTLTANLSLNPALGTPLSLSVPANTTLTVASSAYAVLYAPAAGTALGTSDVTFSWTTGVGVSTYTLMVGTSGPGSSNMFYQSSAATTSATVPTLRAYPGTIYVRLMSLMGKSWHTIDYTFTEGLSPAALVTPATGTSLGISNVEFSWSTGVGVTTYTLLVGTSGPGSSNMFYQSSPTATSASVPALRVYTGTIYVRLLSYIGSTWYTTDYTFTEGLSAAALLTPTAGTPLGTSNVSFSWTAGVGVSTYTLMVGTSGPGSSNMFYQSSPTATSAIVPTLRVYTGTVYVRLMSLIGNTWHTTDYTYTEGLTAAALTTPAAGTPLGTSNVSFNWTAGVGVSTYTLMVGTSGPGSSNMFYQTSPTATSAIVPTLRVYTGTIYVRLMSLIGSTWHTTDYTFTEGLSPAALLTPTAGTSLGTSNVSFSWSPGVGVSTYTLMVGTSGPGSSNMFYQSSPTATSAIVPTLRVYSGTIYVRLMSLIGNTWHTTDYTFTE